MYRNDIDSASAAAGAGALGRDGYQLHRSSSVERETSCTETFGCVGSCSVSLSLSLIFQLRTPAAVRFVERTAAAAATVMSIASNVSAAATASNI